jgi:ribosomal protein S18 acetylase RimI-like enzyme
VAHIAILWALRVILGFRGAGVGTQLIVAAEKTLRKNGYRTCEIGVEDENVDARRLYEGMGYQLIGKRCERRKYRDPAGVRKVIVTDQWLLHKALCPDFQTTAA